MLFTSYQLKNLTLKNRIVMAPMCMYASDNSGIVQDFHKIHYSTRAIGQVGLILLESTAVAAQGRISATDLGIWSDDHVTGLKELARLVHNFGSSIGFQLNHAGRKSTVDGPIIAPSSIPFDENSKTPEAMTVEHIQTTVQQFADAARRAKEADFDVIEIHAAHGYLINQFLSPLSNHRTDAYGGDRDHRYRLLGEIIESIKSVWDRPLLVRISANECHPEGNQLEDYVYFAKRMKDQGVDLIDISSGGVIGIPPKVYPGYHLPLSETIRSGANIPTNAVGLITQPEHAEEILQNNRADLIFLGRELLRDPYWPRRAAKQLGVDMTAPSPSYQRGWL